MTWTSFENSDFLEDQYQKYLADPSSVLPSWRKLFKQLPLSQIPLVSPATGGQDARIDKLIRAYRTYGHLQAQTNCLQTKDPEDIAELAPKTWGFSEADLSHAFATEGLLAGKTATLSAIIHELKQIYCHKIGLEYMGLGTPDIEQWIQSQVEPTRCRVELPIGQKRMILQQLNRSELLETFLHKNFTGQKRFSLEGGETLIPMLSALIEDAAEKGCDEFILGMAHRGRLNVLSNILNKSYGEIFSEFEEGYIPQSFEGSGDVKYHKGFSSEIITQRGRKVKVSLSPNPSHLESVYPVVEGQVRARQVQRGDRGAKDQVLPIIIHGDAAVTGQGVVYETMQMHGLPGYSNGGTLHIVINNHIGFTTLPRDARSTRYCTDLAKAFSAPVFHVNAEYPEDCVYAMHLAFGIMHRFRRDVFIDLNCYRKYGHNEGDEPAFTQPIEYQLIRKKQPIRELYRAQLIQQGVLEREVAEALETDFEKSLHEARNLGKRAAVETPREERAAAVDLLAPVDTTVPVSTLKTIAERFSSVPETFHLHPKLQQLLHTRLAMVNGEQPVDWGMAEHLAIASLLWEGWHVRLAGQDSRRGTFSHRHAMWMDQVEEKKYFPLSKLKEGQGRFDVFNTLLSEFAALGFEFGYSVAYPDSLVIWEAQFGDFCNGGQVIIDQYIATAEQKWGLRFDLVLLLPHGYEGQGPEHSSARIERFLALCAQDNMIVANPTTPLQMFHLLRRQLKRPARKPLIVFTPKGLLRHPQCVNSIQEFAIGGFQTIFDDPASPKKVKKLVLCSGRVYYDLIAEREKRKVNNIAMVRVEQLYPLDQPLLKKVIAPYLSAKEVCWVQEEPRNMGAWGALRSQIEGLLDRGPRLQYIGRERSASPAVGSYTQHLKEYASIMNTVFK
jgi:2-oxoglutarate dehydrogenase E1 component